MPISVGAYDRCLICSRVRSFWRERFCLLNGLGLAENNPILLTVGKTTREVVARLGRINRDKG